MSLLEAREAHYEKFLGQASDEAHERYIHLAFSKQTEALAKLSAIGGGRIGLTAHQR